MTKRLQIYYSGTVQGVGFRFTVRSIAAGYSVSGFVRNLYDGRVEVVAEGEEATLQALASEISQRMRRYITNSEVIWSAGTGEFKGFGIRFS